MGETGRKNPFDLFSMTKALLLFQPVQTCVLASI
jgi:hypothetical protein